MHPGSQYRKQSAWEKWPCVWHIQSCFSFAPHVIFFLGVVTCLSQGKQDVFSPYRRQETNYCMGVFVCLSQGKQGKNGSVPYEKQETNCMEKVALSLVHLGLLFLCTSNLVLPGRGVVACLSQCKQGRTGSVHYAPSPPCTSRSSNCHP